MNFRILSRQNCCSWILANYFPLSTSACSKRQHANPSDEDLVEAQSRRMRGATVGQPARVKGLRKVNVWYGMSVTQLANAVQRDVSQVCEAVQRVSRDDNSSASDRATSKITFGTLICDKVATKAAQLCGFKPVTIKLSGEEKIVTTDREKSSGSNPSPSAPPKPTPLEHKSRPPIVSILGHVDHGKTTLLDSLRRSRLVDKEFGGITQHTGCFTVTMPDSGGVVTFLDTPGHAAFTAMRERGAKLTDIVVLVVAADDGVMPQTVESIRHARNANVPIVVAVNKCDLPGVDPQSVLEELASHDVLVEQLGGDVQCVQISALRGTGLRQLQAALLAQAEMLQLSAPLNGTIKGAVVESRVEPQGRGPLATLLVQQGTLKVGVYLVTNKTWCRVKAIFNEWGERIKEATPGQGVEVMGFKEPPLAGEHVHQVTSEAVALHHINERLNENANQKAAQDMEIYTKKEHIWREHLRKRREKLLADAALTNNNRSVMSKYISLLRKDTFGRDVKTGEGTRMAEEVHLNAAVADEKPSHAVIIRADVHGSLEAILSMMATYDSQQCELDIVSYDIGPPTESDLTLAETFDATVYCFNVPVPTDVEELGKRKNIRLRPLNIIYRLAEALREELEARLPMLREEREHGAAEILNIFWVTDPTSGGARRAKVAVLGCRCVRGMLQRKNATFRWLRNQQVIHEGACTSLRHNKSQVEVVRRGVECGIMLEDMEETEFQVGDEIVCVYDMQVPQVLNWEIKF